MISHEKSFCDDSWDGFCLPAPSRLVQLAGFLFYAFPITDEVSTSV